MGDPSQNRQRIGELLVAAGAIARDQLDVALAEQKNWGGPLGAALVRMGMIDEQTLVRALAGQLSLPVMKLDGKRVNGTLYLGMDDPSDPHLVSEIGEAVGMKIQPVLVALSELEDGIHRHYHSSGVDGGLFDAPFGRSAPDESASPVPEDDMGPLEFADEPAAASGAPAPAPPAYEGVSKAPPLPPERESSADAGESSTSNDAMLRAIAQLLVEKGVITREELVERLKTVSGPTRDA